MGCSLLLAHDAKQCDTNADCEALGFQHWTCDTSAKVCISASGQGGSSVAGSSSAGSGGAVSNGGGGAANGGAANGGAPTGGATNGGTASGGFAGVMANGGAGAGGTMGMAGSAGSGGSGGSAGAIPAWPTLTPLSSGIRVRVRSFCSGSLWLHIANTGNVTLSPDDLEIPSGQEHDYTAPDPWNEGRITAYGGGPRGEELATVQLSVSAGTTYFTFHYMQALGLPAEVIGYGGNCTPSGDTQACFAHQSQVATCPESFLVAGARCLSASTYCLNNGAMPYCHALDSAISGCSGCPSGTTQDVYAGINGYGPKTAEQAAAALNRGMTSAPTDTDASHFYQQPPYNTYAKWAHRICPQILAFPHDDFNSSGVAYPACSATELRITFCPAR